MFRLTDMHFRWRTNNSTSKEVQRLYYELKDDLKKWTFEKNRQSKNLDIDVFADRFVVYWRSSPNVDFVLQLKKIRNTGFPSIIARKRVWRATLKACLQKMSLKNNFERINYQFTFEFNYSLFGEDSLILGFLIKGFVLKSMLPFMGQLFSF